MWVGSLRCTHQHGKRQTKVLRKSQRWQGVLVRLSSFRESPGQVQGNTGCPGARGELNSAISLPRWPGKAERGTAGDGRVTAASARGEVSCREVARSYLGIGGMLGLVSALVLCYRSSFDCSTWEVLRSQQSLQHVPTVFIMCPYQYGAKFITEVKAA